MLNKTAITPKQMSVVKDIHAYMQKTYADYDSTEMLASREQLTDAHGAVRKNSKGEPRKASPFFITRNIPCQVAHGLYTLKVFRLKAEKQAKAKKVAEA